MSRSEALPAFDDGLRCGFEARSIGRTERLEEAWSWLPEAGKGWVVLESEVCAFSPGLRPDGPLVHAEVVDGEYTVLVRLQDGAWHGWTLIEKDGVDTHRAVDALHEKADGRGKGALRYRTYWTQVKDDDIAVWTPVAARLVGEVD